MITEHFTPEEISSFISRNYLKLIKKLIPESDRLKKEFIKRRNSLSYPFVFAKTQTIVYNGNTYVVVYGSYDKNPDNFGFRLYLVLSTSIGKRYYDISIHNGITRVITKHFIDRFIERSGYNVSKDNFLLYLSKDRIFSPSIIGKQGKQYFITNKGLLICTNTALITYINKDDLSLYKGEISDDLEYLLSQISQTDKINIYKSNLKKTIEKNKSSYVNKRESEKHSSICLG